MKNRNWSALDGPWKGRGIAIVGMAGRFPQADSLELFWRNLLDGRDCISHFTRDELLADGVPTETLEQERFVGAGAVLDNIDLFDAEFFGISPREAESMDPQQRLFLEVVQHAFDDAGLDPSRSSGPIAVYAGCRLSGYWLRLMKLPHFMATVGWHQVAAGNDKDFLTTQVSYRFDLRGPSLNVQAACSTSLLAVALGCDALIDGRCDIAVAGAASIAVPHRTGYIYQPSSIASSDGKCRPFDAAADGSVLGNAVAAVVLKRLDDAIVNRDRIYAVIRSVSVNNDGSTKPSFAAPSVRAQSEVIARAVREAGVRPDEIGYVEAHGTATALGDPIEVAALARVFGSVERHDSPLGIGSVKSNVGHLDPVAGLASLLKTALCLHEEEIPATLHFEHPNPAINFAAAGVRVVASREPWPRGVSPRRAGVSAFGIGGTNVHTILEEAPLHPAHSRIEGPQLLLASAKSAEALHDMEAALAGCLAVPQPPVLADVAYTLSCGRRQFKHRRFVVTDSASDAACVLTKPAPDAPRFIKDRRVVFLFPGQGTQRLRMGQALYRAMPLFRKVIDEVFALAHPLLGFDGRELIDPEVHGNGDEHDVTHTAIAQPLLFAVEVACARLWMDWGLCPQQMLGHSIGELVAAYLAGVFTLPDAIRVVHTRGRLMQSMAPGAMLAVSLDEQEALALEDAELRVAAFNAPRQQTISGTLDAISALEARLRDHAVAFTRLGTSHAFHHPSMSMAAAGMHEVLRDIPLSPPTIPFVSCVTGQPITPDLATSVDYWARSLVEPVRFSSAVRVLLDAPDAVFIECGGRHALGSLVRAHGPAPDTVVVGTMAAQDDPYGDCRQMLAALGQVWLAGIDVDWEGFWRDRPSQRVKLPGYAFQRKRFWIEAPTASQALSRPVQASTGPGREAHNCYVRVWAPAPRPASVTALSGTCIILADETGLGVALAEQLRGPFSRAIVVFAGNAALQLAAETFSVDPCSVDSNRALVGLLNLGVSPVHVVNTWTASVPAGPITVRRSLTGALLSLWGPLNLLQALSAVGHSASSLYTVTERLFPIRAGEWTEPTVAPAIGLTRVLPQEVGGFKAGILDILPPTNSAEARALVNQLATELTEAPPHPIVALRSGSRFVESFVPLELPSADSTAVARAGGTYLVTGGFGGIGGVLAKVLARAGGVRIALVGRRGAGANGDPSADAASKRVRELEELGAAVLCLAADLSDATQVARVITEVHSRFGQINGVVHAAGVPGGRMLMQQAAAQAGSVLAPKMQGTISLIEAVAGDRPDFVLMCSSFAAVAGGIGQGEYTAANAFVDAAAWAARALGVRAIAVNWPAWREVGMAHSMSLPPELEHLHRASLESGITPAEGAELFARILAADIPQVVVAPFDMSAGRPAAPAPSAAALPLAREHTPTQIITARAVGELATDANTEQILAMRVGAIWSSVLGVHAPRADDNFFELGGQSLMALQIISRVGEQFGIEMSINDIFENPALEQFSALVHQRMIHHIASMPGERVQELLGIT